MGEVLTWLGLTLHPEKTRVVFVGEGRQGFDFLGFHSRKVESWRYRGRRYLQRWPSRRARQRVRDRVKASTAPRYRLLEPAPPLVDELNRLLRGWGAYFRVGNSSRAFSEVRDYMEMKVRTLLTRRKRRRKRSIGWRRWSNEYLYEVLGLYWDWKLHPLPGLGKLS